MRRRAHLFGLAFLLTLAACQQQAPAPEGVVQVSPAAVALAPGEQAQFAAASPWGSDVTWSVSPTTCGTISATGLFQAASSPPADGGTCAVVATLRSDTSRVGMAAVMIQTTPPVNSVAASGRQQAADGVEVESVVLESVGTVTSQDASGTVESRSGFYPSGTPVSP